MDRESNFVTVSRLQEIFDEGELHIAVQLIREALGLSKEVESSSECLSLVSKKYIKAVRDAFSLEEKTDDEILTFIRNTLADKVAVSDAFKDLEVLEEETAIQLNDHISCLSKLTGDELKSRQELAAFMEDLKLTAEADRDVITSATRDAETYLHCIQHAPYSDVMLNQISSALDKYEKQVDEELRTANETMDKLRKVTSAHPDFDSLVDEFNRLGWLKYLKDVIDIAGEASAKSQGLSSAITSFEKMRNFDHVLYIITKPSEKRNQGILMGLLKVGYKKLYLLDENGATNEVKPMCILDFYVPEAIQRRGHGKMLFEFMLADLKVSPVHLAIDRPSEKFLTFLKKHYSLDSTIPQAINFVIYAGFYDGRTDQVIKNSRDKMWTDEPGTACRNPPVPEVTFFSTAAKRKSTISHIMNHDQPGDTLNGANALPKSGSQLRSDSSSHGDPSAAAGRPANQRSTDFDPFKPRNGFIATKSCTDTKYSHNRLW
ncbi:unnamed protein product [Notodromas monacha]|uniref:Alpha-tubulin N-acetyltransferase n=1 Tax=Notodromas monacha TaxID=399045 RepID=A0A7R9BUN0_9CRUS|nr:unnamed protein product [Notodromas monacha]CAG0921702.1 unnamed protein product [Notodromas monacha]